MRRLIRRLVQLAALMWTAFALAFGVSESLRPGGGFDVHFLLIWLQTWATVLLGVASFHYLFELRKG